MGNSEIMREYLVRLGYQTDVVSLRRFEDNLGKTSKRLLKVSTAVTGIVATIGTATAAFSYSMRKMYFTSQLANSSVKNLNAVSYAGKQIGISGDSMESMIKSMGMMVRLNPGIKALAQNLGIAMNGTDTSDQLIQLMTALKSQPEYIGSQFAEMFGIDKESFLLMIDNIEKFKQKKEEMLELQNKLNVNAKEQIDTMLHYTSTLDKLGSEADMLGTKILTKLVDPFDRGVSAIDEWMIHFSSALDTIDEGILDPKWFIETYIQGAKDFGNRVKGWFSKAEENPIVQTVEKNIATGAEGIMNFFISKGWSAEQSAGIAANLHAESGFDPKAVGDGGKAYGIAQWHPSRQAQFKSIFGKDIRESTQQEQLAFVDWELKNSHKGAGIRLKKATSAAEAGGIVTRGYEIPAALEKESNARSALAETYASKLGAGGQSGTTLNQSTTINVQGNGAEVAAKAVAREQNEVNRNLVRNFPGIVQ